MKDEAVIATDFGSFHRSINSDGDTRFYPVSNAQAREAAMAFDAQNDPVTVTGFGAYDTTLSLQYAIEVYPTKEQAQKHQAADAPEAPTNVLDETEKTDETEPEKTTPPKPTKQRTKSSPRRGGV